MKKRIFKELIIKTLKDLKYFMISTLSTYAIIALICWKEWSFEYFISTAVLILIALVIIIAIRGIALWKRDNK